MSREEIQAALFQRLTDPVSGVPGLRHASRRLRQPADFGPALCPALFQIYKSETVAWRDALPPKRILHLELALYAHSGDRTFPASALLAPLIDGVETALGSASPFPETLGGLVQRVTVNGAVETDEGLLGEFACAMVPVEILIP